MKKIMLLMLISGLFLSSFVPLLMASDEDKTITFHSIKTSNTVGSNDNSNFSTVISLYGVKNALYFAFDFSDFPDDPEPKFAVFEAKTVITLNPCNIEAFYCTSADWIYTNLTRSNAPDVTSTDASNFVSNADKWYGFTSTAFVQAVKSACMEKGVFTVCLKVQSSTNSDAQATFYHDAKMDVIYTLSSLNVTPSPSIPEFPSLGIFAGLAIASIILTAVVYRRCIMKKEQNKP